MSHRSEGVFLWAELVINSIKEGLENGDTLEMLELRLRILPHDIEDLYIHMLGGVSELY